MVDTEFDFGDMDAINLFLGCDGVDGGGDVACNVSTTK